MGFIYQYNIDKIFKRIKISFLFLFICVFSIHDFFPAIYTTGAPGVDDIDTALIIDGTAVVRNFRYKPTANATLELLNTIKVEGLLPGDPGFFHIHIASGLTLDINIDTDATLQSNNTSPAIFELSGDGNINFHIKQGHSFTLGGSAAPLYMLIYANGGEVKIFKKNDPLGPDTSNSLLILDTDSCISFMVEQNTTGSSFKSLTVVGQGDSTKPNGNNGAFVIKINDKAGFIVEMVTCDNDSSLNNIYTDIYWNVPYHKINGDIGSVFLNIFNKDLTGAAPIDNTTYSSVIIENNNTKNILLRNDIDPDPVLNTAGPNLFSANTFFNPYDPTSFPDLAAPDFTVPRSGFILTKSCFLDVGSLAYCIYMAGGHNYYPQVLDKNTASVGGGNFSINYLKKQRNNSAFIVDTPRDIEIGNGVGQVTKAILQNNTFDFSSIPPLNLNLDVLSSIPKDYAVIITDPAAALYFGSTSGLPDFVNEYQPSIQNNGASVSTLDYTVPAFRQMQGPIGHGNIVFAAEGKCAFYGLENGGPFDPSTHIVNILSDEVQLSGDYLIPGDSASSAGTIFPKMIFPLVADDKKTYGKGCMLFGDKTFFVNTTLLHTDSLHNIFLTSDIASAEPCYIGGDHYALVDYFYNKSHNPLPLETTYKRRPKVLLVGSNILIANRQGFATSGFDFLITSPSKFVDIVAAGNNMNFQNNSNLKILADGTDDNKYIVLGSANDGSVVRRAQGGGLDFSSNLDVVQDTSIINNAENVTFTISTGSNNSSVLPYINLTTNTALKNPVVTIYLGGQSDIHVWGDLNASGVAPLTPGEKTSTLNIDGKFINITSEGGLFKDQILTGVSKTGGIVVGKNGIFKYSLNSAGNLNATLSRDYKMGLGSLNPNTIIPQDINGVSNIGIEDYEYLSDIPSVPGNFELIDANSFKPVYVFDSKRLINGQGYELNNNILGNDVLTARTNNILTTFPSYYRAAFENIDPFTGLGAPNSFVDIANIATVPYISGRVGRLILIPSSSAPLLEINGGKISEIMFNYSLVDFNKDGAFNATLILSNKADIGIGSSKDLLNIPTIGNSGFRFIVRDSARIDFNSDVYVSGPNPFMSISTADNPSDITIGATDGQRIIVPSGQVFDLTGLQSGSVVRFIGNASLILESGSVIAIPAGVTLEFDDISRLVVDPNESELLDDKRFSYIIGQGNVLFKNRSELVLLDKSFLSISSLGTIDSLFNNTSITPSPGGLKNIIKNNLITDITITFNDSSRFIIGDAFVFGGSFEVGNRNSLTGASVKFKLILDGSGVLFKLGKKGFLGLNAGLTQRVSTDVPSDWLVKNLNNISSIDINILNGIFDANQIASSDISSASLIAFGNTTNPIYSIKLFKQVGQINDVELEDAAFDPTQDIANSIVKGGSNVIVLKPGISPLAPIVADTSGDLGSYKAGVLATAYHLRNGALNASGYDSESIFNFVFIKSNNHAAFSTNLMTNISSLLIALKNSNEILRLYSIDTFNLNTDNAESANLMGVVGLSSLQGNNATVYALSNK